MASISFAPQLKAASKGVLNAVKVNSHSSSKQRYTVLGTSIALASAATAYYINDNNNNNNGSNSSSNWLKGFLGFGAANSVASRDTDTNIKPKAFYQQVYNDIALKLRDEDEFDDGSYGPILVRLAWHSSGSHDRRDKTEKQGGSYAGTMRFEKEQKDPENAGLGIARDFLKPIKEKYPELSYGDLYTLGGVTAIQELSGPKIQWRPGRVDQSKSAIPPYHRLPDAHMTTGEYVRSVFGTRLGFNDREMVNLIGVGHAIGRCHSNASGFDGPWTFSPTMVTNDFFTLLLNEEWELRKWDGPEQYTDTLL
ncbi:unnamed protein product [Ambrosiozyma monospora]|uniref:Peroxidase n=1 Tax=Ambrosiozyma monospora TaxID=43982 RepID=A0A9W7DJU0_AMBMO|nr:unnamed protein product [Ambrosiozyma monospora]